MAKPHDVVIAGGGIVGAALGYELAGDGMRTLLVDRADEGRATAAGAGILSAETVSHDGAWFTLAMAASEHYRRLIPALVEAGAGDAGYAECGLLQMAFREGDDATFADAWARYHERSPETVVQLAPDRARELFPALGEIRAALHNPGAARIDGRMITAALLDAAVRRGLERRTGSVDALEQDGERVVAVTVDGEHVACGAVVIAGGAWSPQIGDQLGIQIPVVPVRGQIAHVRLEGADTGGWPIVQPVLSFYTVAWPDGRLAVGGTVEPDAGFDARVTASGVRDLLREVLGYAPGLADATLVEVRVGLRPVTIDDTPVLGALPGVANAFVATGHGANGLLLGPISARLVADVVLGRQPAVDLTPFAASRFARK
jgi:D-amino-acid dehydrogenase